MAGHSARGPAAEALFGAVDSAVRVECRRDRQYGRSADDPSADISDRQERQTLAEAIERSCRSSPLPARQAVEAGLRPETTGGGGVFAVRSRVGSANWFAAVVPLGNRHVGVPAFRAKFAGLARIASPSAGSSCDDCARAACPQEPGS